MNVLLHTGLVADPVCKDHDTGPGHPENSGRYDAAYLALCRSGLIDHLQKISTRPALNYELQLAHTEEYISLVESEIAAGQRRLSTGDTPVSPRSLDAARYAAGGAMQAVDAVCGGKVKNAFGLIRPPGHHAGPGYGMGFCLFNHIAIAARHAQKKHRLERVLIVDWDVHHGNGTQDIFFEDGSVFYFSVHQSPWYPGTGHPDETGRGHGRGTTLNVPLPAGSGRREIFDAFENKLAPVMADFRPQLILISAGFDSCLGDPLGEFTLTADDVADMTRFFLSMAHTYAGGRLISLLEGGYDPAILAAAVCAHVRTLSEDFTD